MQILQNITFIDGLLIFIIINLILLYIYQTLDQECHNTSNSKVCKFFGMNKPNSSNNSFSNSNNTTNNINTNNLEGKNNKLRLLMNDKGPEVGFHQNFKPHMPELGWRDFYLRLNGGISGVNELNPQMNGKDGVNGVITRNYLKQLECTDNVYSHVDY